MRILIKLGGALVDSVDLLQNITQETAEIAASASHKMVLVHGGGKQMTRYLAERGVESRFVNGLRVTTPDVIDAVVKVFAGSVNARLVTALRAAGAQPVGLSGLAAGLVDAEILNPDLGQVGRPVRSDARLLEVLTDARYLPVVACIAGDAKGLIYNVNADQMAVACAAAFRVEKLLFLTDVEGVRDAAGKVRETLTSAEARSLIADGVATGGMQAKLEAAMQALERHVGEVLIAPGARPRIVRSILDGTGAGTRLIP
jgi:acetylglutamate kinase